MPYDNYKMCLTPALYQLSSSEASYCRFLYWVEKVKVCLDVSDRRILWILLGRSSQKQTAVIKYSLDGNSPSYVTVKNKPVMQPLCKRSTESFRAPSLTLEVSLGKSRTLLFLFFFFFLHFFTAASTCSNDDSYLFIFFLSGPSSVCVWAISFLLLSVYLEHKLFAAAVMVLIAMWRKCSKNNWL